MSFKPRWYQEESVRETLKYYFEDGGQGNALIALPTGSGKSYTLCELTKEIITRVPQARVMVLTHVKELIAQNHKSMINYWPQAPAGIYSAGLARRQVNKQITFAGIASVAKRAKDFGHQNVIVVDECHLISDKDEGMYLSFIAELKKVNPNLKVIGLTATPYRLGMGSILEGGIFDVCTYNGCTLDRFNRMIDEGYLSPLVPRRCGVDIDTSKIKQRGGEFVQSSADAAINTEEVTRVAIAEIAEAFEERKHLMIFAQSVEHCGVIVRELAEYGVKCVQVHSKMKSSERDANLAAFIAGRVPALVNMGVLTTGFDMPHLDMIAVLRMTNSTSLWVQILGRGTRVHPNKKDCLIMDFAGNTKRLGAINDPVIPRPKGVKGGGQAPVKICPECDTYMHTSKPVCDECGFEFPKGCNLNMQASSDALVRRREDLISTHVVRSVFYKKHNKKGKAPSLRVTYQCGLTSFDEWVSVEGDGWARKKAEDWMMARIKWGTDLPTTVDSFLAHSDFFNTPHEIVVDASGKHPQVVSYSFSECDAEAPF